MIPFSAIIFDMDGLLVDSEVIWHQAEREFFAERGIPYTDDLRALILGIRIDVMFHKLKPILNLQEPIEDMVAELTERMLALIPHQTVPQPGAREIVAYVSQHHIPTAIASSSPQAIIDAIVKSQHWCDIFTIRCSADDVPRGKPEPDVYLYAAEKVGVPPAKCLALEDTPVGARAAVAAGMTCYAVPDLAYSKPESFAGVTPHVFNTLHDVLHALRQ